ncbi:acyl-CoA carboxylase subunit epsilon [Streptomyces abyssomicinicus]|uniref:acyl-CoA carboxylase subunit epsilon n=1 Tax=Streptomyces abyssomicinicus TaxID=574929 RepID=UPI00124FCD49|nr:acyl-CoA carboxylase subunit epsilon [Streptomyces abyssomicinicus]
MAPIRVLHGQPTPEEVAVVVALLTSLAAASLQARTAPPPYGWNCWNEPKHHVRRPGPTTWRTSALPL